MANEEIIDALKSNYEIMKANGDVSSPAAYERAIDPLLGDATPEVRREIGQTLWQEFYAREEGTIYAYTGLAVHLDPPVGGS